MNFKPVLHLIHEGKAPYPECRAYRDFFGNEYQIVETNSKNLNNVDANNIYWHLMGFYPRKPHAGVVIHDYRSLSVGAAGTIKDFLKRYFNAEPDIRIFQSEALRNGLGFPPESRDFILPMGIPEQFLKRSDVKSQDSEIDFIYIGSMIQDRRCDYMIDSFIRRFGKTKIFHLYGPINMRLVNRYKAHENIRFMGVVDQKELPSLLVKARCAVNYFPNWYPHIIQTPTKLLEYAALGMRIISNEQASNRKTADTHKISCLWGPSNDIFACVPDQFDWPDNHATDLSHLSWSSLISNSGLREAIQSARR